MTDMISLDYPCRLHDVCICNNDKRGGGRRTCTGSILGYRVSHSLYCDCDRAIIACAKAVKSRTSWWTVHHQKADDLVSIFSLLTSCVRC